jgi:potassium/chloride transporter 9
LQLGCILNTVPAWKKSYKLRVAVFVEYESDVEEERRRVQALLVNLRIKAEVLVFWLASGDLATYEIIVNGQSPDGKAEKEVDECLVNQDWWEEIQKARGKRGEPSPNEEIAGLGNVWNSTTAWPEASFQQGPRHEKAERFLGLRKLIQNTKRRHTISGLSNLGVNLGMRAQRLPAQLAKGNGDQSDDFDSEDSSDSDSEAIESDDETRSLGAVPPTGVDDHDFGAGDGTSSPTRISRRRSCGDSLRNPLSLSRSTRERDSNGAETDSLLKYSISASHKAYGTTSKLSNSPRSKASSSPDITKGSHSGSESEEAPVQKSTPSKTEPSSLRLEDRFSALRKSPSSPTKQRPFTPSSRPSLSRHASQPKFTSKPVPVTRVATEEGIGPSIMFTDTPSPPLRTQLRSAYDISSSSHQNTNEAEQNTPGSSRSPSPNRFRGSSYATQAVPLSFNDLPCRAQHLILNELMRKHSKDTAVMFTTLPSPVESTSRNEDACLAYLSDLEVLGRGCPPCLMVHSNSMTVTMSL